MDGGAATEGRPSEQHPPTAAEDALKKRDSIEEHHVDDTEDNKFQKAIAAWRNIDLTSIIPTLDNAASDLVAHQRDALIQRKDLAQKTKDFRKLDDATKLGEIKSLLKAYQTFIDLISNQSKSVSSAFLQLYSPLSEAPDPYPLLEASIDSLVTADETLPRLEEENQRLQGSVTKLTAQLEDSEKQLEQERTKKQALEGTREEKVKEIEASWSAVLSEKENNWKAKEEALEEKVENQERLLKEIKASYEVSQRLDKDDDDADTGRSGATAAELEIVSSELDRANSRLAEVELRNEQLRLELAQSASQRKNSESSVPVEEDPAYLRLRTENSSLLRKIDNARFEKDSEKRKWEGNLRSLEREVSTLKSDRDTLREKVQRWGDYEDVKSELEVLKSIEFASGVDEDWDRDDADEAEAPLSQQNGTSSTTGKETLEQLLLARNKKLSNELTVLRVSHQDLQTRLESLQEDLTDSNSELSNARNLAATLEIDLVKVQQEASNAFPPSAPSIAGTYTSRYPRSSYGTQRERGRISPTSSIISGFDPHHTGGSSPSASLEALRAGEPVGGGSGMLPMIIAQRDRFKKRNAELESALQKEAQTVSSLRSEIATLQKDNLALYEKTRYVSTYSRGNPASSASSYAANPNPSTVQIAANSNSSSGFSTADARYRNAYETSLTPFAAFRGRESARAMRRMSLPERVVFQVARAVLQTRRGRNLFAVYCAVLHGLVFVMLFWMGGGEVERGVGMGSPVGAGVGGIGDRKLKFTCF
ncbi:hypothetical protein K402DRAFT_446550 [Aulographum hederae CBS 113979]|uniref:Protein CASP n=1 Tax=Aulographum hederae CBS 113979 TaxID=1176131 RepID=A0A6G1GZZ1_9PEZI|nr:hypothetical protein K402DRAFT_446550 [Aulographum hederae CBS 113979]